MMHTISTAARVYYWEETLYMSVDLLLLLEYSFFTESSTNVKMSPAADAVYFRERRPPVT